MDAASVSTGGTGATYELTELDRHNHRKITRAGWAVYDLADTIWSYAIFSRAISLFLVDKLGDGPGNLWLGLSVALSVGINALVSPFLGAISDRFGRRLPSSFSSRNVGSARTKNRSGATTNVIATDRSVANSSSAMMTVPM